jgi:hypothetical protein
MAWRNDRPTKPGMISAEAARQEMIDRAILERRRIEGQPVPAADGPKGGRPMSISAEDARRRMIKGGR